MIEGMDRTDIRYDIFDIVKWIGSLMVIVIHTRPLRPYSLLADVYTAQGLCRIAVPLFFMVTSFLLYSKATDEKANKISWKLFSSYFKKTLRLYLCGLWSITYMTG